MQCSRQADSHQSSRVLHIGDRIVFTGDMEMSRAEIEALATAAGLRVTTSVSRKTFVVVAADPHSRPGKASNARRFDVPMVTEQVFVELLDRAQPPRNITIPAPA